MTARQVVEIPPNLIDDAKYLAAEVSIYAEDATEGILLLEELGLANRCRMEGPAPPPPKTRMVLAHELRNGQYLIFLAFTRNAIKGNPGSFSDH